MDVEEPVNLVAHVSKRPRLVAVIRFEGVAVHGVAAPHHLASSGFHCLDDSRQVSTHSLASHSGDEGQTARLMVGVKGISDSNGVLPSRRRAKLDPQRITHVAQELHVSTINLTGPLTNPQQMARAIVG